MTTDSLTVRRIDHGQDADPHRRRQVGPCVDQRGQIGVIRDNLCQAVRPAIRHDILHFGARVLAT